MASMMRAYEPEQQSSGSASQPEPEESEPRQTPPEEETAEEEVEGREEQGPPDPFAGHDGAENSSLHQA